MGALCALKQFVAERSVNCTLFSPIGGGETGARAAAAGAGVLPPSQGVRRNPEEASRSRAAGWLQPFELIGTAILC